MMRRKNALGASAQWPHVAAWASGSAIWPSEPHSSLLGGKYRKLVWNQFFIGERVKPFDYCTVESRYSGQLRSSSSPKRQCSSKNVMTLLRSMTPFEGRVRSFPKIGGSSRVASRGARNLTRRGGSNQHGFKSHGSGRVRRPARRNPTREKPWMKSQKQSTNTEWATRNSPDCSRWGMR